MISCTLIISLALAFVFQNTNAQGWFGDKPTPAEVTARDKPFLVLQNEIETKLCDNDWGIGRQLFLFYKDNPELNEVLRGTSTSICRCNE